MNFQTTSSWLRKLFCLGILTVLAPSKILAGQANVDIEPGDFNPQVVTISPGDDVVWTWVSEQHNTVGSFWDSGIFNTGYVYTNNFPNAGTFPYICIVHGFDGTVIVDGGLFPTVNITSPTNGATFTAPAIVPITATASDPDGTVTNVAFFDNTTLLGQDSTAPYSITNTFAAGAHPLHTVATDNDGLSTTSTVVNISVSVPNSPPSVTITNPVDGAVLSASAGFTIRATASDSDGSVTNVRFFDGTNVLGNDPSSPYTFNASGLSISTHAFTAMAFDNLGATSTSPVVNVTLARYLPAITNGEVTILLQLVATNLAAPLYGVSPPGDHTRLFVLEQKGLIRVIENGVLLPTPALDITNRVQPPLNANSQTDERGLLGLAFHPGYTNPASPGYRTLYTYNSERTNGVLTYPIPPSTPGFNNYKNVVNEWKISTTNASVIDPNSRREVVSFGKSASNHNGGTITFGPDGYAYLALGDGGDANDAGNSHIEPGGNAQNLSTPLGKFLRFDPLDPALTVGSPDTISANGQYRIPLSNPFQGVGQVPEIYAYGVRNPYRFSFDTLTGDLIHSDVGQNNVEEIDKIVIGGNYGWAVKEGDFLFNHTNNTVPGPGQAAGSIGNPPGNYSPGSPAGLIDPISGTLGTLEYDHNEGISITGGFVYRGKAIPELYGKYIFGDLALKTSPQRADGRLFYADLQTGLIKALPLFQFGPSGSAVLPNGLTVHGFGQDADGEIYAFVTNTSPNGNGGLAYKLVPLRVTIQLLGGAAEISWPVPGGRLQSKTNNLLGGIWSDVPNTTTTNRIVINIDPGISVFYRLAVP
jgi:glucose/arabinose dehydrogenase